MGSKKANQGAVTSISDTDLVMVCAPSGKLHPVAFANIMAAIRGGIQIGGRNLLQGTSKSYTSMPMTQYSWLSSEYLLSNLGLGDNELITLSATIDNTSNCVVSLGFEMFNSESDRPNVECPVLINPGENKRVSVTGLTLQGYRGIRLRINNKSGIPNKTVRVSCMKLERGNIATDWTPAPEDITSGLYGGG